MVTIQLIRTETSETYLGVIAPNNGGWLELNIYLSSMNNYLITYKIITCDSDFRPHS